MGEAMSDLLDRLRHPKPEGGGFRLRGEAALEITRLRALLREGLELPKSWEDWFARVRKELDHASHG